MSQVGPSTVAAGIDGDLHRAVVNTGRSDATNLVITETLTAGYTRDRDLRRRRSARLCPATLGPSMTLPSLGPGRSLTLTYAVAVPARQPRQHRQPGAGRAAPPTPTCPTTRPPSPRSAIDGRNGAYKAYAANGQVYDLTIDFDALNYTMTVNGAPVQKTFAAGAGEYIVAGTQRLRTAADLVIGNHDFGTGLVPYIAARRFGTTLVDGVFNLATRNVAADGTATTHPGTARISGNVLSVCQTDTAVSATQNCPVVLTSYLLSVDRRRLHRRRHEQRRRLHLPAGALRRARSSCSAPLTAPDATQQLRVGLQESAGPGLGHAVRADEHRRLGDDGARRRQHLVRGARRRSRNDQAGLQRISNAGPFAMMVGKRLTRQRRHLRPADPAAGDRRSARSTTRPTAPSRWRCHEHRRAESRAGRA